MKTFFHNIPCSIATSQRTKLHQSKPHLSSSTPSHPLDLSQCQKDTEQTLRATPTTPPVVPTHEEAQAITIRTVMAHITMPTTTAAHTTTLAQADRDQPHTQPHPPLADHHKAVARRSEIVHQCSTPILFSTRAEQ